MQGGKDNIASNKNAKSGNVDDASDSGPHGIGSMVGTAGSTASDFNYFPDRDDTGEEGSIKIMGGATGSASGTQRRTDGTK